MQTFGVLVVGGALGLRRGGMAAFLYVALGVIGLPFFAEGTGGPSGDLGRDRRLSHRVRGRRGCSSGGSRSSGGTAGWAARSARPSSARPSSTRSACPGSRSAPGCQPREAIAAGLLPFLAFDIVKALAAAVVFPAAWWVVGRRPSDR